MSERKPEWPEASDLVIATVEHVADYGAYAKLYVYAKQGLLHQNTASKFQPKTENTPMPFCKK